MARYQKSNLVANDVVTYRNGKTRIYIPDFPAHGDIFLSIDGDGCFGRLDKYDEHLVRIDGNQRLDIVRIAKYTEDGSRITAEGLTTVWDENDLE